MSNELAAFDPNAFKQRVSERIKSQFADLIPEDAWQKLIDSQIEEFWKKEVPRLIKEELEATFRAMVKEELNKPEFLNSGWSPNSGRTPSDAVKAIIAELAPELMQAIFGSVVQAAVEQMRSSMGRGY